MLSFDLSVLRTSLALLLLLLAYRYIIQPCFISPLSKIPNAHPTSAISSLWITWVRYRHRQNRAVHAAHEAHGPVVRLGPNEVSINCVDRGLRTVYTGGFEKPDWYSFFENHGYCVPIFDGRDNPADIPDSVPNMFSILRTRPHSSRKRMISNIYSKSYLRSSPAFEALSREIIHSRLLPTLEEAARSESALEVQDLFHSTTMDFITAYLFGLPQSSNFIQDQAFREHWLRLYQSRHAHIFHGQETPALTGWLKKFGIRMVPAWIDEANRELEAWCLSLCDAAEASLSSENAQTDTEGEPVVYSQVRNSMLKERSKIDSAATSSSTLLPNERLSIASEMLDHLAAGHETSGITLTYLIWELSQNPSLQCALRTELHTLRPMIHYPSPVESEPTLPSPKDLDCLPLLDAIIMETLRLHPAIPGAQPRITPSTLEGTSLGPYRNIPANVVVHAQPYSLHREAAVFPEPHKFLPHRWLDGDREQEAARARWFWAFGSGGRGCVGKNFAMQGSYKISCLSAD
ncbi:MAG: hypothetical protein M1817_005867 [Caeruleum heppii]|nr:MAG: hypothetical protein M1817_005867 [Caeruleum heppii]